METKTVQYRISIQHKFGTLFGYVVDVYNENENYVAGNYCVFRRSATRWARRAVRNDIKQREQQTYETYKLDATLRKPS